MSIDITNLLSISNNSLFQTTTKQATNTGDFSTALLNALNATQTTSDNNPLYTTLTAATNTAYGNASTQYMQYLSQYNSSSNNLKGYMTNFSTGTQQANGSLIAHFQSQLLNTLSATKTNLSNQATAYMATIGDAPSQAATSRMAQMQENIHLLDQFIANKQADTNLLNQMQQQSSLTQYLVNQNKTSSL